MDDSEKNLLREMRQSFQHAAGAGEGLPPVAPRTWRAKVFKSGNSLALRLPKALGLQEGSEMILRELQHGYSFEPVETPKRKLDVASFWGKAAGMVHVPELRRDFEPRPSSLRHKP